MSISILMTLMSGRCCAQATKDKERMKFLKMNLQYKQINSEDFSFGNLQPAFVTSTIRNYHEMGLTNLALGKAQIFEEYKPAPTFLAGVVYAYKRNLKKEISRWNPQAGLSFSLDYRSVHLTPRAFDVHKEMYQDIFTYKFYGNVAMSYRISSNAFIDIDLPVMIWNAEYFRQKDLLPITRQIRYLSSWGHSNGYFTLNVGFRYRI